jgi:uncharacterized membrane protein SpoIIM required for sporulation
MVAAGHTALYRDERHSWKRVWRFFSRDCPSAVVGNRVYVLAAFLVFALPALGGFALLKERPALAEELLPAVILQRAEAGVERRESGTGRAYAQEDLEARPVMASMIITNNVGVAFVCFATGIFVGVGSIFSLAYNGLAFGAISGHFANRGVLSYLWTFVLGHGVLELFAIFVAGAAGFLMGTALIAPGEYTRKEALVVRGRQAMAMIGFVVVCLVIAGTVEGFVSAGGAPLWAQIVVSGLSAVFLVVYLWNGRGRASVTR